MAIEITSVSEQRRASQPIFRPLAALLLFALAFGADELLRSYRYYSRLIDTRLASGYLTSRPGLYAAPRTIRAGQGFTQAALVKALQRSGYLETQASAVWSGSFKQSVGMIEIRPRRVDKTSEPRIVQVGFSTDRIYGLTGDNVPLESFTLEPEVLTNDLSSKTGDRKTLSYHDIPPVLVHAVLAIEDRRFFEHPGLDLVAVGRALFRNAVDERVGQGGSTISQQLVKNTYLSRSHLPSQVCGSDVGFRSRATAFERRHLCVVLQRSLSGTKGRGSRSWSGTGSRNLLWQGAKGSFAKRSGNYCRHDSRPVALLPRTKSGGNTNPTRSGSDSDGPQWLDW